MHENRPQVYAPYISSFSAHKVRDIVTVAGRDLAVSRGPSEVGYDISLGADVILREGHAVLTHSYEKVGMPLHLSADVVGKSTWARLGISLNTTKVDPGFSGNITLEITYNPIWTGFWDYLKGLIWPRTIRIPVGTGIGTLVFTNLAQAVRYDGKYTGKGTEGAL